MGESRFGARQLQSKMLTNNTGDDAHPASGRQSVLQSASPSSLSPKGHFARPRTPRGPRNAQRAGNQGKTYAHVMVEVGAIPTAEELRNAFKESYNGDHLAKEGVHPREEEVAWKT
jgi:hypothetical protein